MDGIKKRTALRNKIIGFIPAISWPPEASSGSGLLSVWGQFSR
ncbi:hypothetical protein PITC_086620 [Penicillium italicum]|uniref:Uncharacterized protein n=1 Tax=Penicillium italicum TaxID=40296 RepID=A0A0A2KBD2_PENIT|nr:hypothetical protein PITC_086620 [Penicillium italicum]